ncbi:hypothetical protein CAC42_5913 [Sphaceloma murrayae]|uniref:Spermatogenesis-associated protein 20-like TRX domain-containing protein n=1 Tax=Sphaceloma murrayae TaxID=2082308 RepID=A0A2K1QZV9_9PEZI|nr:hypothetical protein CAC42_5913 [Sphaceloma murrayae]
MSSAVNTEPFTLANQCLQSKSPYVRSHSNNPTAWQLWTPETLRLARQTNKLLFVSIGYSACHWCHVMAHESFNHPKIAHILNENFIPIKIDREERPDVDRVYMDFLQATTGGGGWPLNVFVTPQLEPIFGGTYWPGPAAERKSYGADFERILDKVATAWKEQEQKCRDDAGMITAQLRQFAQEGTLSGAASRTDSAVNGEIELPDIELLEDAYEHYKHRFDSKYGGFGGAPKFPTPAHLSFLMRIGQWDGPVKDIVGDKEIADAQNMVVQTLKAMAKGAIKDQVSHGFSRYSVTRDWSLPHFEKMLYDNAQLLSAYLDGYLITKDPLLSDMVHDVATYLSSTPLQSENGGFHASEDADSAPTFESKEHREGAFYVWTADEINSVVREEKAAALVSEYYNVMADGNVSPRFDAQRELAGQNTLCITASISDLAKKHDLSETEATSMLASAKSKLLDHRNQTRPRPHLDDKILTSWNGLAISALARTAAAFSSTDLERSETYLASAQRAATFIKTNLYSSDTQTLKRVFRESPGLVPGFADDYAHLITGLLDLYTATFDASYLEWAYDLQQTQLRLFYDTDGTGGFFSTEKDATDVLIRSKDAMDNAEPSTNGVSASNLFRLGALLNTTTSEGRLGTGEATFEELATRTLRAFEVELGQHPGLMTGLLGSVVLSRLGVKSILVAGEGEKAEKAVRTVREGIWPGVVLLRVRKDGVGSWLEGKNETLKGLGGKEMVQVCEGTKCMLVGEGDELEGILKGDDQEA